MESPNSTTWLDIVILVQRVDFLSFASIAEMRKIPFIPFPDDMHPKAVEFAMIVRNEFTKRLKSKLVTLSSTAESSFVRGQVYKILRELRNEIVLMAGNGTGWLEVQLEHVLKDSDASNKVYRWADRYLDSMLLSIGV
jgi:hypothetical protein